MTIDPPSRIGARIRELRQALGYESATEFARAIRVTLPALSNWESGFRRIQIDEAIKIVEKTGVSLDWIYNGRETFLPKHISDKLEAFRAIQRRNRA